MKLLNCAESDSDNLLKLDQYWLGSQNFSYKLEHKSDFLSYLDHKKFH